MQSSEYLLLVPGMQSCINTRCMSNEILTRTSSSTCLVESQPEVGVVSGSLGFKCTNSAHHKKRECCKLLVLGNHCAVYSAIASKTCKLSLQ